MMNNISDMTPIKEITGTNCVHLTVFNVLKSQGCKYFLQAFKQCGLYIYNDEGTQRLGSNFLNLPEELRLIHKISVNEFISNTPFEFHQEIKKNIDNNVPVIVWVDTYELEFNMFFKNKHMLHVIVIIGYDNEMYHIIDDTYNFKGSISFNKLEVAARHLEYKDFRMFTISFEDYLPHLKNDKLIHSLNLKYLLGEVTPNEVKEIEESVNRTNIKFGIESIDLFCDHYENLLSSDIDISENTYDALYNSMTELSNAHYRYLSMAQGESLKLLITDIAQQWKVAANMALKGMLRNDKQMLIRMVSRVRQTKIYEEKLIEYLGSTSR